MTYRTCITVNYYCQKCNGKLDDPHTKKQHFLITSQQLSQTEFNELRQPTGIASEFSSLSQQSITTIDSKSDNELQSGSNNELPSSLNMDDLSFLLRKHSQTSTAKMIVLNSEEPATILGDESSNNNIVLDYNNSDNDDGSLSEELAEDIRYSNINEFEDYSALDIDYEKEFQSSSRVSSIYDNILIWQLKYQSQFKVSEEATEVLVQYIRKLL